MRRIFYVLYATLFFSLIVPSTCPAADNSMNLGSLLPIWSILPFAGILFSIALIPLFAPHFWGHHFMKISAFWALVFAVPFLYFFREVAVHEIVHIIIIDYIPFVLLLWALFTVSGGIYIKGTFKGSPAINTVILLIGTVSGVNYRNDWRFYAS